MNEQLLYYWVMFLCNIAETTMALLLLSAMLKSKHHKTKWWIIWICLISLSGYVIISTLQIPPILQYLIVFILFSAYSSFWEGTIFQKVFSIIFTISFITIQRPILSLIETHIFPSANSQNVSLFPIALFNESVGLFFTWIFCSFFNRNQSQHLTKLQRVIALFYPCAASIMLFLISKILQNRNDPLLIFLAGLLIISLIGHFALTEMLNIQNEQNLKLSLLEQQSLSENEKVEALLTAYTSQRKLTHEFNNHISAIDAYLQSKQYGQAQSYINQLSSNSNEKTLVVNTGNTAIDVILSQKYTIAFQKNLSVSFYLCDLSNTPIKTSDLVVVISNLFSNAIEGTEGIPNGKINIKIQNTPTEFLISVQNQVLHDIPIYNNTPPKSTKKEFGHGIGLTNTIEIAQKYNGYHLIQCQNQWFQVTLLINNPHNT